MTLSQWKTTAVCIYSVQYQITNTAGYSEKFYFKEALESKFECVFWYLDVGFLLMIHGFSFQVEEGYFTNIEKCNGRLCLLSHSLSNLFSIACSHSLIYLIISYFIKSIIRLSSQSMDRNQLHKESQALQMLALHFCRKLMTLKLYWQMASCWSLIHFWQSQLQKVT